MSSARSAGTLRYLRALYRGTRDLGGKISGEHGIGVKRKAYLGDVTNPVEMALMRAIKRAWDPHRIMNPGKIFDLEASAGHLTTEQG